jgi:hypothetical protein
MGLKESIRLGLRRLAGAAAASPTVLTPARRSHIHVSSSGIHAAALRQLASRHVTVAALIEVSVAGPPRSRRLGLGWPGIL